jgi:hypothetical protein
VRRQQRRHGRRDRGRRRHRAKAKRPPPTRPQRACCGLHCKPISTAGGAYKQQVNAAVARQRQGLSPPTPFASSALRLRSSFDYPRNVTFFEELGAVQSLLNRKFWTQWSRR